MKFPFESGDDEQLGQILAERKDKSFLRCLDSALKHSTRLYKLALELDQAHGYPCVEPGMTRETLR